MLNTLKYGNSLKSNIFSSALNTTSHVDIIKNRIEGILSDKKCKRGRLISVLLFTITVISMASFNGASYAQDDETSDYTKDFIVPSNLEDEFVIIYEKIIIDR